MAALPRLVATALFCSMLGLGAVAQEASPSIAELTALAEGGDSAAQFNLGNSYLYGKGTQVDEFAAANWYRKAAQQGNHNAQYNLAIMYMQGKGVLTDMREAVNWFERAANLGDAQSQFTLGTFFANGRVVPQDPVRAHMWFTLAASAGHKAAAANLVLYQEMLSDSQIIEAQDAANQWVEKFNAMHQGSPTISENEVARP
ncbi:MAG: tetratricopeptide repeat protein [Pseudohongiellaceae bacterium]|nr:tetratricopeptide repeat protein [Pseudohongiellaceae bacterium]